jgi:CheY-like chemotaxis protein
VVFDEEYCQLHHDFTVGEYVLIAVSDDGAGMSKEVAGQIFEPFFTTKGPDKGTGLGLSTVYGIIRQNLGFINVYSELGEGTTFRMYLPRFSSEAAGAVEADGAVKAALAGKAKLSNPGNVMGYGTVLLVEDELPLLRLSALMLENLGYSVKPADSPEMALRLIDEAEGAIDLLMTDVVMPGMTGLELYRAAVGKLPHLRCLYMSGYTPNVIVHKGILDREVFFIQKPFSLRDLSLKIQEVLAD